MRRPGRRPRRRLGGIALVSVATLALARDSDGALAARFAHLSVEQGLSQSTVQVVHQDSAGFLWFGTEEGLNRYDGYAVSVFKHDPARPQSLPDDRVRALLADSSKPGPYGAANPTCVDGNPSEC